MVFVIILKYDFIIFIGVHKYRKPYNYCESVILLYNVAKSVIPSEKRILEINLSARCFCGR